MPDGDVKKATDEIRALTLDYAQLIHDVLFGDVWKRPPLSQRDKSLITVACLVAANRIEQVELHLKKAIENGLTEEELAAAITHISFYARCPTAASGLDHLKNVIEQDS